jgi:hypothetical protein
MVHFLVMAGLDPAIHVFSVATSVKTWMPGTRPGMTSIANGDLLAYCEATFGLP